MSKKKSANADRDESLEIQHESARMNAGQASGLGDRSGAAANTPGRAGAGGGVDADYLREPTSGATDPTLDENERSYGDSSGPARVPANVDEDSTDEKAQDDGADRDIDEGSADSRGKADFLDIDA